MRGEEEDKLGFRYSREERLRNATEAVRSLNDGGARRRPSLFKTLVPNRASAFLLLAIIMLSLTILVTNILNPGRNEASLPGTRLRLSAFAYDQDTYVTLRVEGGRGTRPEGPIALGARLLKKTGEKAAESEVSTFSQTFVLSKEPREELRFRLAGTGDRVDVQVRAAAETRILSAPVQR